MRALRAGGAGSPEQVDDLVVFAPDRGAAVKLRARQPGLRVVVAGEPLPLADGALDAIVDECATGPGSIQEDARVVRSGGRLTIVSAAPTGTGLAAALGGLLRRSRQQVAPADASAWLLGAGCAELTQQPTRAGTLCTEGVVQRL